MITHRKLNVPNFEQCDTEIKNAFHAMRGVGNVSTFWTFENDTEFFARCPTVVDSFKQLGVIMTKQITLNLDEVRKKLTEYRQK